MNQVNGNLSTLQFVAPCRVASTQEESGVLVLILDLEAIRRFYQDENFPSEVVDAKLQNFYILLSHPPLKL